MSGEVSAMRRIAFVLAVSLAIPIPGRALDLPPVIANGGGSAGWTSIVASTGGSQIVVSIRAQAPTSPTQAGVMVYNADDMYQYRFTFSVNRLESQVIVDQRASSDAPQHEEVWIGRSREPGMGFDYFIDPHGVATTYKLLMWVAPKDAVWTWEIRGVSDVATGARDGGSSVELLRSRDFAGTAHAEAIYGNIGARADVSRDRTVVAQDTLVALFAGANAALGARAAQVPSVTTPNGEVTCVQPCEFVEFRGSSRAGPGTYVFHITGASWGIAPDVSLTVIDARLPG